MQPTLRIQFVTSSSCSEPRFTMGSSLSYAIVTSQLISKHGLEWLTSKCQTSRNSTPSDLKFTYSIHSLSRNYKAGCGFDHPLCYNAIKGKNSIQSPHLQRTPTIKSEYEQDSNIFLHRIQNPQTSAVLKYYIEKQASGWSLIGV